MQCNADSVIKRSPVTIVKRNNGRSYKPHCTMKSHNNQRDTGAYHLCDVVVVYISGPDCGTLYEKARFEFTNNKQLLFLAAYHLCGVVVVYISSPDCGTLYEKAWLDFKNNIQLIMACFYSTMPPLSLLLCRRKQTSVLVVPVTTCLASAAIRSFFSCGLA
jgi:hypothetical protein